MSNIMPTEQEMLDLLLQNITAKELDIELKNVEALNPFYKKVKKAAYAVIAKNHNISITIKKPTGNFDEGEGQETGELTKITDFSTTPFTKVNINAWLLDIVDGISPSSKKANKKLLVADETGFNNIWVWEFQFDDFNASNIQKMDAIHIEDLELRDGNDSSKDWFRFGFNTTIEKYKKDHGELCEASGINYIAIDSLPDDEYTMIKVLAVSETEEKDAHKGCVDCWSSLKAPVGSSIYCKNKRCEVNRTVTQLKEATFVVMDESGERMIKIPAWSWMVAEHKRPQIKVGETYLIFGKYTEKYGNFALNRLITVDEEEALPNYVTAAQIMPDSLKHAVFLALTEDGQSEDDIVTKVEKLWNDGNPIGEGYEAVGEILLEFKLDNIVFEPTPSHYALFITEWDEIKSIIDAEEQAPPVPKLVTIDDLDFGDESEFEESNEEVIANAKIQFKKVIGFYGDMTAKQFREALAKKSGNKNYQVKPIIEALLKEGVCKIMTVDNQVKIGK